MEIVTPTLLITGISGYIGSTVAPVAAAGGYSVMGTYFQHRPDAARLSGITPFQASLIQTAGIITDLRPDVILHTAAAWRTEEEAQATIVDGTRSIATADARVGSRLIHMSTDLVFDGEHAPYSEKDAPVPINFYGSAKAEAERIIMAVSPNAVVVRTSLVTAFAPPDPRTQPVLAALRGIRPPMTLFTDEFRCPIRAEDLVAALVELMDHPYIGTLHVAGPERMSRYELGLRIAAHHNVGSTDGLVPGRSLGSGLSRPRDCTLSIALANNLLRTPLRPLS
jgi:dTDP-4-dehydrorhamnose reductase